MEFMLQVLVSLCLITFAVSAGDFNSTEQIDDSKPEIICSSELVKAAVNEDVTLQCHLVPPINATNMTVNWRHETLNHTTVLIQDGHTSLFPEELTKGNLSLKISSVQLFESGRYRCSVTSENLQHSCYVNLTVEEPSNLGLILGIVIPLVIVSAIIKAIIIAKIRGPRPETSNGAGTAEGVEHCCSFLDFLCED